jgi:DNA-binding transcriptional LysR family regulator
MEMHQIRYFLTVAETLNFTRAAEECHVAQPSLSRAVKKLEEELGGDLFRRERGQTHLTDLGRSMLPLLRQSYDAAVAAKEQAGNYRKADVAPLRIGLSRTIGFRVIAPVLGELSRAFPGLDLHLSRGTAEEILTSLKAGDLELAIAAAAPVQWERFDHWPLFEEGFVVVAPAGHPKAGQANLSLADIAGETIVGRPYCESEPEFLAAAEARHIALNLRHEAAGDRDAVALVERGLGFGILPESADCDPQLPRTAIADFDFKRTVQAYAVAGRQRSVAAGGILRLLRATDWPHASA